MQCTSRSYHEALCVSSQRKFNLYARPISQRREALLTSSELLDISYYFIPLGECIRTVPILLAVHFVPLLKSTRPTTSTISGPPFSLSILFLMPFSSTLGSFNPASLFARQLGKNKNTAAHICSKMYSKEKGHVADQSPACFIPFCQLGLLT